MDEVTAQAVPPYVGSPTPGNGYESGDPFAAFLPPAVKTDEDGFAPHNRAVVFVTEYTIKGTERSGQEYAGAVLVLTGEEYARITIEEWHRRICDALRGNLLPVRQLHSHKNEMTRVPKTAESRFKERRLAPRKIIPGNS